MKIIRILYLIILIFTICSCSTNSENDIAYDNSFRLSRIPDDSIKVLAKDDIYPPILHSDAFEIPKPLEIISTSGAEDSPFIPSDADKLYFMFVKDVRETPEIQVNDKVNGIWVSEKINEIWSPPELIILQKDDELALNGAEFVYNNEMLFVSAREGYNGLNWFKAIYKNAKWDNWRLVNFEPKYEVGELHIHNDIIYFHSYMDGGKGDMDIWYSYIEGNQLSKPTNLKTINTSSMEGWPYISPDGNELWYTGLYKGTSAIYRAKLEDNNWGNPELIISQFAGEPTLDSKGNLYFVHHYYKNGIMIEADIYMSERVTGN